MKPDVYAKMKGKGFTLLLGVEVIEEWKDGCRIRSEQRFPFLWSISYHVIDGESLVAVRLAPAEGEGPFDYVATKDLSNARPLEDLELQIR